MERDLQLFLTVNQSKWIIANGLLALPAVQSALHSGKLLLKGGTTVSCLAELLWGKPLRISGRLSPAGAGTAPVPCRESYSLLVDHGICRGVDGQVEEIALRMGPGDAAILGANLIDTQGGAAMLCGSPGGGSWGKALAALTSEGAALLIPAGLEKLSPTPVAEAIHAVHRRHIDACGAMACGLCPLTGQVFTEVDALRVLAPVQVWVMGRGGIQGAEGGTLLQLRGAPEALQKIKALAEACRGRPLSGCPASLARPEQSNDMKSRE